MKKKYLLILFLLILLSYISLNFTLGKNNNPFGIKDLLSAERKQIIKKYIFPYKLISEQTKKLSSQQKIIIELEKDILQLNSDLDKEILKIELEFKESLKNIDLKKLEDVKLSNNLIMNKYKIINGFYSGINEMRPGGYLDFHQNNLLILSARGILGYNENIDQKLYFKQIKNNINDFIGLKQFQKNFAFSLRDLFINKEKIYISYTEEIENDCWNTSVLHGNMNYQNIKFKKLFSSEECFTLDMEGTSQTGGRIVDFDNEYILLTIGQWRNRNLPQNKNSINGKMIKINTNNSDYEIISMGHRNQQGLFFDKEKNIILATEHGPLGGDEINLIEVDKIKNNKILNYGWAVASYGEHYCSGKMSKEVKECADIYKKYPLYKSHSEHGFIEPLKFFVPEIIITEITKVDENRYVVGSIANDKQGGESLYFFELNNKNKIVNMERIKLFERVRDLRVKDNRLYLFLEQPSSIGILKLN